VRQQRVEAALVGHLQTAEAELAATVPGLREAALHHGHDLMLGWNDRLQQAGVEYVKVLRQIAAEASAAGNPAVLRAVGDVVLVDLTAPASPWVSGGRVKQQDGSTLALGADAIDATLAAELSGPRRLLAEVQSYASHAQREAQRLAQRGTYAGRDSLDVAPATVVDDAPARTTTVQVPPTARRGRSPSVAARVA
jgi:hypothetical protein